MGEPCIIYHPTEGNNVKELGYGWIRIDNEVELQRRLANGWVKSHLELFEERSEKLSEILPEAEIEKPVVEQQVEPKKFQDSYPEPVRQNVQQSESINLLVPEKKKRGRPSKAE